MKKTVDYKLFINAEHDIIYANLAMPFFTGYEVDDLLCASHTLPLPE